MPTAEVAARNIDTSQDPLAAVVLKQLVETNEEWLMERILFYAREFEYAKYTSTLLEAWRLSISGLTGSLVDSIDRFGGVLELGPNQDYSRDPIAAFGMLEARRHRVRGVPLQMFLGLTKYYRQSYEDLVQAGDMDPSIRPRCRLMVARFFDRVELGFIGKWLSLSETSLMEELQESNRRMTNEKNRYLTLFESLSSPVFLLDREGRLENLNHAAAETFIGAKTPGSFYYGRKWVRKLPWLARVLKENPIQDNRELLFGIETQTPKGMRHFEGRLAPMLDVSGKFAGTVVILNDITEREKNRQEIQEARDRLEERVAERTRELEEANRRMVDEIEERKRVEDDKERVHAQLLQAQKMDAIGTLAGGIAHDLNNLLQIVMGNTQLVEARLDEDSPLAGNLGEILAATERSSTLIRQLMLFSRNQPMQFRGVDLNRIVEDMSRLLKRLIGENIRVEISSADDLRPTLGDPGSLEQVLMNLVLNSRDAMPEGGTIRIRTANSTIEETAKVYPGTRPGNFVRLTVEDTGCGMNQYTLARVFEPFFTTKPVGQGTGLGLSVVYGIVQKHEGWVNVYSEPDMGTVFNVFLPVFAGDTDAQADIRIPLAVLRGAGQRILVVEDERGVRAFLNSVLTENGYKVTVAGSAEKALVKCRATQHPFDLILSDVVLAGFSGPTMAEILKGSVPEQRFVFISGYTADQDRWPAFRKPGFPLLPKPFSIRDLLATVKEALE